MTGVFTLILVTLYEWISGPQPVWSVAFVVAGIGFLSAWGAQIAYRHLFKRSC